MSVSFPVVLLALTESVYNVSEGDGSVEVCVELTQAPAGGLECNISVTLELQDGLKAGINLRIKQHCASS